jgi:hypothetical protein
MSKVDTRLSDKRLTKMSWLHSSCRWTGSILNQLAEQITRGQQ